MKLDLRHMSREDKLRAMHQIWEDLAGDDARLESPAWHADALRETADRVASGNEKTHDWADAKAELRKRAG